MASRRLRLLLDLDGMIAVHAVRALHTAFSGLDGVETAHVTLGHAELLYVGNADDQSLRHALARTAEVVGLSLTSLTIEPDRRLPLA